MGGLPSCSKTSLRPTFQARKTTRLATASASRVDTVSLSISARANGAVIGNDWNGNPSRFGAGSALMMDVCRWDSDIPSTDPGQSWQQRGDQIVGNPIIDGNGEQKGTYATVFFVRADPAEQCLDVRSGDLDKGVVQMWYCVDSNTNQKWVFEPL